MKNADTHNETDNDNAITTKPGRGKRPKAPSIPSIVQPKSPGQWHALLAEVGKGHWRVLRITIKIRDRLLAGKPRDLNVANAMLKARGLEDQIEATPDTQPERGEVAARVAENDSLCEFHRRPDRPGIWLLSNSVKAGIKENWSVLGFRSEHWGSRVSLAEGMFVYADSGDVSGQPTLEHDYIYLGEKPDGVVSSVCHSNVRGEQLSSIKRNEYVEHRQFSFIVKIAARLAPKIPDEAFAQMLVHFGEHGLGASRSQGHGKFDVVGIEEV